MALQAVLGVAGLACYAWLAWRRRLAVTSFEEQLRQRSRQRTLCEVLRLVWGRSDAEVQDLVEEAYGYAKRMDRRLREYKADYDRGWWRANV